MYARNKLIATLFIYLIMISSFSIDAEQTTQEDREYVLNTKNLGLLFHRATTTTLLQSKARRELKNLPETEKILYDNCVREAKTLLKLAKCVTKVLDARDQMKLQKVDVECQTVDNSDGNWLNSLFNSIFWKNECMRKVENNHVNSQNSTNSSNSSKKTDFQKINYLKLRYHKSLRIRQKFQKTNRIRLKSRPKRHLKQLWSTSPNKCHRELPKNVKTLRHVEGYFEKLNHVIGYVYSVSKSNEKFFEEANLHVQYQKSAQNDPTLQKLKEFTSQLETFDDKAVISILSPKLLNVLPQTPKLDVESKEWLSPNMLSFQNEGLLPLPRLLQLSTSNHCETLEWLDLLMHVSGASKMLQSMTQKFSSHMQQIEKDVYPHIQQSIQHDQKFNRLFKLSTEKQKQEMMKIGYAQMNRDQMRLAYGPKGIHADSSDLEFHENEDIELAFEGEIRQISQMTDEEFKRKVNEQVLKKLNTKSRRQKRGDWIDQVLPMTNQQQVGRMRVLEPFAFTQRVRNANIMGPYILSPYAYLLQLFAPTLLGAEILSPRAFIATIFSPVILVARILSPAAFRLMLFSPLALVVWVMVPESFSTKLFSPKLLEARILSSDSFSFVLLSPAAGIMRAGSPNAFNILVLSPAFATYQLFSGNRNVIQILSPGILGIDSKPLLKEPLDEAKATGRSQIGPPSIFPQIGPPSIFPQIGPPSIFPQISQSPPSIFPQPLS